MAEGITFELFYAALVSGVVCTLLLTRMVKLPIAMLLAFVKIAVPFLYFAHFNDGTWTNADDVTYFNDGSTLINAGFNPLSALLEVKGRNMLFKLAGGHHILYSWWNLVAQYLFGSYYFSAVFLNLPVAVVGVMAFCGVLKEFEFSRIYRQLFLVFGLLHFELLVYSSFMNIKDIMVMALTNLSLYLLIRFLKRPRLFVAAQIAAVFSVFFWLRFYVPVLLLAATIIWAVIGWRRRIKYLLVPAVLAYIVYAVPMQRLKYFKPAGAVSGAVRFVLTPRPWSLEPHTSYLMMPATLNLMFFLPAIFGAVLLLSNRKQKLARAILIYFALIVVFYGLIPSLQTPRHRLQISTILYWLQFHGLLNLLGLLSSKASAGRLKELLVNSQRPLNNNLVTER